MQEPSSARMALEGVRVVDFTQMMLGPFATQFLGDMGADIVKIERPVLGEWERGLAAMGQLLGGDSPFFLAMNRNKRSLTLDLKAPEGKEIVRALVREADVVVENFTARRAGQVGAWIRGTEEDQSAHHLCVRLGFWRERAVCRAAGAGPADPGDVRLRRAERPRGRAASAVGLLGDGCEHRADFLLCPS